MSTTQPDSSKVTNEEPPLDADGGVAQERVFRSMTLMGGHREVTIVHAGERYRLRITSNDKLILTK